MTPITPETRLAPDDGVKSLERVQRINQRWIVHGRLRQNAAAFIEHLRVTDPQRLQQATGMALRMVHRKKAIRDPKPLFYAGLFSVATVPEIKTYLGDHAMTLAISLLLHGDASGRQALAESARDLADGIAAEIREERHPVH